VGEMCIDFGARPSVEVQLEETVDELWKINEIHFMKIVWGEGQMIGSRK
jgi:hypothetical protein